MSRHGAPSQAGERPAIYYTGLEIARTLGKEATKKTEEAWALETTLRQVRLACSPEDLAATVSRLEERLAPYLHKQAA